MSMKKIGAVIGAVVLLLLVAGGIFRLGPFDPGTTDAPPATPRAGAPEPEPSPVASTSVGVDADSDALPARLTGLLLDRDTRQPVDGIRIAVRSIPDDPTIEHERRTRDSGRFALEGLPAGRYELRAEGDEHVSIEGGRIVVDLAPGESAECTLEADVRFVVAGTVVYAGSDEPVPGARLSLRPSKP